MRRWVVCIAASESLRVPPSGTGRAHSGPGPRPGQRAAREQATTTRAALLRAGLLRPLLIARLTPAHFFSAFLAPVCSSTLMQQFTGTSGTECSRGIAQVSVCFGQHFIYVICEGKWQSSHALGAQTAPGAPGRGGGRSQEGLLPSPAGGPGKQDLVETRGFLHAQGPNLKLVLSGSFLLLGANSRCSGCLEPPGPAGSGPGSAMGCPGKTGNAIFRRHRRVCF